MIFVNFFKADLDYWEFFKMDLDFEIILQGKNL